MSRRKLLSVVSLSLLILFLGGIWVYNKSIISDEDVFKFTGGVTGIEGDKITLNGVFTSTRKGESIGTTGKQGDFAFKVNNRTVFEGVEIKFPSWEEADRLGTKDANGAIIYNFKIQDLPKHKRKGSLADLTRAMSMGGIQAEATFTSKSIDSKSPVASKITYTLLISPSRKP